MSEYNGWTNYETWQCALWIDNDPYLYAAAEDATADGIRELITDYLYEQSSTAGLLSDIVSAWESEVNFREIFENRNEVAA